jgi:hypothetical protein
MCLQSFRLLFSWGERFEDAFCYLLHIRFALTQIWILHPFKLFYEKVKLNRQSPFGVLSSLADQRFRYLGEHFIVQNHAVDIEEGCHFLWSILW